jgi:cytochrome b6-f complex iron-sulfur subunit
MDRKEFLRLTGIGGGAFIIASCLGGCKKDEDDSPTGPQNIDFTLDLSQSGNSALNNPGGYIYKDGVIVARTNAGTFLAVSSACSHQGTAVLYELSQNRFHCPNHGSDFTSGGAVINGPASAPLKSYNASLNGNILHVFS